MRNLIILLKVNNNLEIEEMWMYLKFLLLTVKLQDLKEIK
jgi:hypothetical protein